MLLALLESAVIFRIPPALFATMLVLRAGEPSESGSSSQTQVVTVLGQQDIHWAMVIWF